MDISANLQRLGQLLQERRMELGLRRAELGRRIGVSATYIGLIEQATPRREGRAGPSRPTEAVLRAWTRALDMDAQDMREVLGLAGYRAGHDTDWVDHQSSPGVRERRAGYGGGLDEEALLDRVRAILRLADESADGADAVRLLDEVIRLVQFRLEHRG